MKRILPNFLVFCFLTACATKEPVGDGANPFLAEKYQEVMGSVSGKKAVNIVYSSNLQGELGTCGCAFNPTGGVDRRLNYVNSVTGGAIVLDSGNAFFKSMQIRERNQALEREKATLMAKAHARIGVKAQNVGRFDLSLGPSFLKRLAQEMKLPLVSANILDPDGKHHFQSFLRISTDGAIGLFVTGLSSADSKLYPEGEKLRIADSRSALQKVIKEKQSNELLVVLSDLSRNENLELAQDLDEPALFIGSTGFDSYRIPAVADESLLLQPLAQGQELGRFVLVSDSFSKEHAWLDLGNRERLSQRWTQLQQEREFLKKQEKSEILKKELERNERSMDSVRAYAPVGVSAESTLAYESLLVEMNESWAEVNELTPIAQKYK